MGYIVITSSFISGTIKGTIMNQLLIVLFDA